MCISPSLTVYDKHDDKHLNDLDCSSINVRLDRELPQTSSY